MHFSPLQIGSLLVNFVVSFTLNSFKTWFIKMVSPVVSLLSPCTPSPG